MFMLRKSLDVFLVVLLLCFSVGCTSVDFEQCLSIN